MTGAHRSASPASRRPMACILGALFAGSAVMFTAAVVPDGPQFVGDGGVVAGPRPEGAATVPAPETAAVPQVGTLRTGWEEGRPGLAWQSTETATEPSPTKTSAHEISPDEAPGQSGQWAPDAPPDWATSLREALAQRAPAYAQQAPAPAAQRPPTADNAEKSDGGLVEYLLGKLDTES